MGIRKLDKFCLAGLICFLLVWKIAEKSPVEHIKDLYKARQDSFETIQKYITGLPEYHSIFYDGNGEYVEQYTIKSVVYETFPPNIQKSIQAIEQLNHKDIYISVHYEFQNITLDTPMILFAICNKYWGDDAEKARIDVTYYIAYIPSLKGWQLNPQTQQYDSCYIRLYNDGDIGAFQEIAHPWYYYAKRN